MEVTWFIFDLGNTVIKLAYERVMENICNRSTLTRDELVDLFEEPGGYRDLERGAVKFAEFHEFLRDKGGYRGALEELRETWSDFFDGLLYPVGDALRHLVFAVPLAMELQKRVAVGICRRKRACVSG